MDCFTCHHSELDHQLDPDTWDCDMKGCNCPSYVKPSWWVKKFHAWLNSDRPSR